MLPKNQQSNVWTYTILCIRNFFASQKQMPQDQKVNEGNTSPTPNNRDTPISSGIQIIQIIVDPVSHKITTHKKTICSASSYTKRRRVKWKILFIDEKHECSDTLACILHRTVCASRCMSAATP